MNSTLWSGPPEPQQDQVEPYEEAAIGEQRCSLSQRRGSLAPSPARSPPWQLLPWADLPALCWIFYVLLSRLPSQTCQLGHQRARTISCLSCNPLHLQRKSAPADKITSVDPVVLASASLAALYCSQASGSHIRLGWKQKKMSKCPGNKKWNL